MEPPLKYRGGPSLPRCFPMFPVLRVQDAVDLDTAMLLQFLRGS